MAKCLFSYKAGSNIDRCTKSVGVEGSDYQGIAKGKRGFYKVGARGTTIAGKGNELEFSNVNSEKTEISLVVWTHNLEEVTGDLKGFLTNKNGTDYGLNLVARTASGLKLGTLIGNGSGFTYYTSDGLLETGKEYALGVTYKDNTIKFYINGVLDTTVTGTDTLAYDNYDKASVGVFYSNGDTIGTYTGIYRAEIYEGELDEQWFQKNYEEFLRSGNREHGSMTTNYLKSKPTDLSREVNNTIGNELIADPEFDVPASWTPINNGIIANGVLTCDSSQSVSGARDSSAVIDAGKTYRVIVDIQSISTGSLNVYLGGATGNDIAISKTSAGQFISEPFTAVNGNNQVNIYGIGNSDAVVNSVSVVELTGIVAGYNMIPNGATLVDISGNGNNGTIESGIVPTKEGLKFDGAHVVNCTQNPSITVNNFTFQGEIITGNDVTTRQTVWGHSNSTSDRIGIVVNSGYLSFETYDGSDYRGYRIPAQINTKYNYSFKASSKIPTVYVNGQQLSDSISGGFLGGVTSEFKIGGDGTHFFLGEVTDFRMYSSVLSNQACIDYHNSFRQPYKIETWKDNAVGETNPKGWDTVSGSYEIEEYAIQQGQLVSNGDFATGDLTDWTNPEGNVTVVDQKAVFDGTSATERLTQVIGTVFGNLYKVHYEVSNYTQGSVIVQVGGSTTGGTGINWTTRSSNGVFEESNYPSSAGANTVYVVTSSNFKGSIDNIRVTEVSPLSTIDTGTKLLTCNTAGVISAPNTQAYGEWEFPIYKGADGNAPVIIFMKDESGNGYAFRITASERPALSTVVSGSVSTDLFYTAASYINNNTLYCIKITRSTSGVFTMYIKGGSFGDSYILMSADSGYGTNPVTNNTYTTSNFIVIDNDAGDKVGPINMFNQPLV